MRDREQAFYIVRPDGRKIVMTLDCLFGENDDESGVCLDNLKEAYADNATFAILDAEEAFKSYAIGHRENKQANNELEPIETAVVTKILPTKIWAEKGFSGVVHIKAQHESEKESFNFVQINYSHKYTSNAHQQSLAFAILKIFGVADADCKIMQATTNITEQEKQFISVLEDALMKCASKFAEYERHHMNKGDDEKANANKVMVDMCHDAMNKSNILQMMS
jgi:hypothetical protein